MKPLTVILFGRSGSGKGTQAELLSKRLKELDPENKTIYVETGQRFREFISKSATFTAKKTKDVLAAGGLMPAFMPIWLWTGLMVDEIQTGKEHMVLDGLCRRVEEPPILDSAMKFYGREGAAVVLLDVSKEEGTKRLLKRARYDDHDEKIKERMAWFERDVVPAMKHFQNHPLYKFITINGEQPIDDVHKALFKALGV